MQFITDLERSYYRAKYNTRQAFDAGPDQAARYWYWRGEMIAAMRLLESARQLCTLSILEAIEEAAEAA
jgi:hypothetical protein